MFKKFSKKKEEEKPLPGGKNATEVKYIRKWAKKYSIDDGVLISLFENGFDSLQSISLLREQ
jgi:hypothetical protein